VPAGHFADLVAACAFAASIGECGEAALAVPGDVVDVADRCVRSADGGSVSEASPKADMASTLWTATDKNRTKARACRGSHGEDEGASHPTQLG
jgi:hypothetical protein